jgi:hypothetical protein
MVSEAPLRCQECRQEAVGRAEGWRAYLLDDQEHRVIVYCCECAEREFGPPSRLQPRRRQDSA